MRQPHSADRILREKGLNSELKEVLSMKTEYIFYTVGIIFMIAAVLYFTWDYLFQLARSLKIAALLLLTLFFYFMANFLRERDL